MHRWMQGLILLVTLLASQLVMADEVVRLNIAAFEKRDAAFQYDPMIMGKYSDLLSVMESHADIIFLDRTPPVRDKDVINVQVDAMRLVNGQLSNAGLNCQFSFDNESDEDSQFYSLAGLCTLLKAEATGTRSVRVPLKRVMLSDANYGNNVWMKVYEDTANGVILYADVDPQ